MPRKNTASIGGELTIGTRPAEESLKNVKRSMERAAADMGRIKVPELGGDSFARTAKQAVLAAGGIGLLGKAAKGLFTADLNAESAVRSLAAVTTGLESVKDQMEALSALGQKPGIGFSEALQGSVALQAVGVSSKDSRDALEQFSNALASVGGKKEDLDAVTMSLRQMMSAGVNAQDLKEISRRIPAMTGIARIADRERSDPQKWLAAVVNELRKLPRVTAGAQESVDNLTDSWERFKTGLSGGRMGALVSGAADAGAAALKGKFSGDGGALDLLGMGITGAVTGKGRARNAVDKFEPNAAEIAKRQRDREDARREEVERAKEELGLRAEITRLEIAASRARVQGFAAEAARLENEIALAREKDRVTLMAEAVALADRHKIKVEEAVRFLEQQNAARRTAAKLENDLQLAQSRRGAVNSLALETAQARGQTRRAKRLEKEEFLRSRKEQLRAAGFSEAEAAQMAGQGWQNKQDAETLAKTGRNRIRGARSPQRVSGLGWLNSGSNLLRMEDGMRFPGDASQIPGFQDASTQQLSPAARRRETLAQAKREMEKTRSGSGLDAEQLRKLDDINRSLKGIDEFLQTYRRN